MSGLWGSPSQPHFVQVGPAVALQPDQISVHKDYHVPVQCQILGWGAEWVPAVSGSRVSGWVTLTLGSQKTACKTSPGAALKKGP